MCSREQKFPFFCIQHNNLCYYAFLLLDKGSTYICAIIQIKMQVIFIPMMICLGSGHSTCDKLSFSSCQVCYENYEGGLLFQSCQHTYCALEFLDWCVYHGSDNLLVPECFETCCGRQKGEVNTFSLQHLEECKEYNSRSLWLVLGMTFSLPFALAAVLILCHSLIKRVWREKRSALKQHLQ